MVNRRYRILAKLNEEVADEPSAILEECANRYSMNAINFAFW